MVYMESHHLLSSGQYSYITSQIDEIPNKSENLKRVSKKIEQAFKTFDLIIGSDKLDQEYKNKVFPDEKIIYFIDYLLRYNPQNPSALEENKQAIAKDMIKIGFTYFQERYKATTYLKKQIDDIQSLLDELNFLSQTQQAESEGMELYRLRKRSILPPITSPEKDDWLAECIHCYRKSLGVNRTESEAVKNIRHEKKCAYTREVNRHDGRHKKSVTLQFIRTFPPSKKS